MGLLIYFVYIFVSGGSDYNLATNLKTLNYEEGSLSSVISSGVSQSCEFVFSNDGSVIAGKFYISGNKFRNDFETNLKVGSGADFKTSVIRDGEYAYTWSQALKAGTKIKINNLTQELNIPQANADNTVDLFNPQYQIKYKCKPWVVDQSIFTPPSDVKFINVNESLDIIKGRIDTSKNMKCDSCNLLQGEDRAVCLNTYNCN